MELSAAAAASYKSFCLLSVSGTDVLVGVQTLEMCLETSLPESIKKLFGSREMAQWLTEHTALPEDLASVPGTHIRQTAYKQP